MVDFDGDYLRDLLMEIGEKQFNVVPDETSIVSQSNKVYALLGEVVDMIGVWKETDVDRSTDLFSGGSFDGAEITLGTNVEAGTRVIISYVQKEGMNDISADWIVESCEARTRAFLWDSDDDYDLQAPSTLVEKLARQYWIVLSLINAYLLLNNMNMIQGDANISTFDFSTMTKLWGEGMSTDALFGRWYMELKDIRKTLMILDTEVSTFTGAEIKGYWKDENMFTDWLVETVR